jgi:hypothetical protein
MVDHDSKNEILNTQKDPFIDALKRDEILPHERDVQNAQMRLLQHVNAGEPFYAQQNSFGAFVERLCGMFSLKPVRGAAAFACLAILMVSVMSFPDKGMFDDADSFDVAAAPDQWVGYEAAVQSDDMRIMLDSLMLNDLDDVFL